MIPNEEKQRAVMENDAGYDGRFYYAVRTTGIYCRPSCVSRRPLEDHIAYFDTQAEAESAGFRPCKRCRPELSAYDPDTELAEQVREIIDSQYAERAMPEVAGVPQRRLATAFKKAYGVTMSVYRTKVRMEHAKTLLATGSIPVSQVALDLSYDSSSAFYAAFHNETGMSPAEYRAKHGQKSSGFRHAFDTDIGRLLITLNADGTAVTGIRLVPTENDCVMDGFAPPLALEAERQLRAYLAGELRTFQLPLQADGTDFQRTVWWALCDIPYGETRSYKQIAEAIGKPGASRAVGMANNKNPLLIVVPCHRVVGANGALVGYAAGLAVKEKLLSLEQQHSLR